MDKIDICISPMTNTQLSIAVNRENSAHLSDSTFLKAFGSIISVVFMNGKEYVQLPSASHIERYVIGQSSVSKTSAINFTDQAFSSGSTFGSEEFVWSFYDRLPIIEKSVPVHHADYQGVLSMINREVPISFISCGLIFFILFAICTFFLVSGFESGYFPISPQYLLLFSIGFLGMTITDLVAIWEWRKKLGWKERERP